MILVIHLEALVLAEEREGRVHPGHHAASEVQHDILSGSPESPWSVVEVSNATPGESYVGRQDAKKTTSLVVCGVMATHPTLQVEHWAFKSSQSALRILPSCPIFCNRNTTMGSW